MYSEKIGIIGGFGAYATLHFYRRILEEFAGKSEREYPHIIMDNNFTMPSRTRALLYNESYDEIVRAIAASFEIMLENQVNKIVMVCGTAHYFLEDVFKIIPEAKSKVVNIVDCLGERLQVDQIKKVLIVAAEGTLLKNLYSDILGKRYHIECISPKKEEYSEIRFFIEGVKGNHFDDEIMLRFQNFLDVFGIENVVLGCTEFPILVEKINWKERYHFYDPLEITIQKLKETLI